MNDPFDSERFDIQVPEIPSPQQGRQLKLALLDARRTSNLGVVLLAVPCVFVFVAFATRMHRGIRVPGFAALEEWMLRIDQTPLWFLPPAILVGLPLLALTINALAILNVRFDRSTRELQLTFKLRPLNIALIAICVLILSAIALYVVGENHTAR